MRINLKMVDSHTKKDLEGSESYDFDNIPKEYRKVAQNIILVLMSNSFPYYSMSNFDKKLILAYWQQVDRMPDETKSEEYSDWFVSKATLPEDIRQARQWLLEKNFIKVNNDVAQRAADAGLKRHRSI